MSKGTGLKHKAPVFPPVIETEVGKVLNYSGDTKTATIELTGELRVKNEIRIASKKIDLTQIVEAIQVGQESVEIAEAGQSVSIKVNDEVRNGDKVFTVKKERPIDYDEEEWEKIVFRMKEKPSLIEIEKAKIVVTAQAWRKYDLDKKFNRGNMTSPFYDEAAWHQGEKVDVYYITIDNQGETPVEFKLTSFRLIDNRKDEYPMLDYRALEKRLLHKKGRTIDIDNGMKKAKEILLEMAAPRGIIKPKQKVEGYLPFYRLKSYPTSLTVVIPLHKAPDLKNNPTGRYKEYIFVFPFAHSPSIRTAQPATIRF